MPRKQSLDELRARQERIHKQELAIAKAIKKQEEEEELNRAKNYARTIRIFEEKNYSDSTVPMDPEFLYMLLMFGNAVYQATDSATDSNFPYADIAKVVQDTLATDNIKSYIKNQLEREYQGSE